MWVRQIWGVTSWTHRKAVDSPYWVMANHLTMEGLIRDSMQHWPRSSLRKRCHCWRKIRQRRTHRRFLKEGRSTPRWGLQWRISTRIVSQLSMLWRMQDQMKTRQTSLSYLRPPQTHVLAAQLSKPKPKPQGLPIASTLICQSTSTNPQLSYLRRRRPLRRGHALLLTSNQRGQSWMSKRSKNSPSLRS